jgi:hypothetical protein
MDDRVRPLGPREPIELTDVQAGWVEAVMRNVGRWTCADTLTLNYGDRQVCVSLSSETFAVAVQDAVRWLVSRAVQLASRGAAVCTDLRGRDVRVWRGDEPQEVHLIFWVPESPRTGPRDMVVLAVDEAQMQRLMAEMSSLSKKGE